MWIISLVLSHKLDSDLLIHFVNGNWNQHNTLSGTFRTVRWGDGDLRNVSSRYVFANICCALFNLRSWARILERFQTEFITAILNLVSPSDDVTMHLRPVSEDIPSAVNSHNERASFSVHYILTAPWLLRGV